ncbi:MAG: hypothetical protein HYS27_07225 [Deltaproteobacteria bacterium]|nr:hypothetical protein [Deltaproteobacteria bacterium]
MTAPPVPDLPWWSRALLDALAAGRLPTLLERAVHARALRIPAWHRYYHQLRAVERAAAGNPALSAGQRDVVRRLVLDAAAPERTAHSRAPWLVGAAAVAAAAVLLVVTRPSDDDAWTARGGGAALGVRVACADPYTKAVRAQAEAGVGALGPGRLSCRAGDVVLLSGTNLGDADRWLDAVLVGSEGAEVLRTTDDEAAFSLPRGSVARALPRGFELASPGRRALFVVFYARAAGDPLGGVVDGLSREGFDALGLARLPLRDVPQARVDIDVAAADASNPGAAPP